jgi:hypothetical protein
MVNFQASTLPIWEEFSNCQAFGASFSKARKILKPLLLVQIDILHE